MDRSVLFELTLEEISLGMSPGDNFIFYTDGVVEARDSRNREFEEKMLLHVVKQKKFDKAKLVQEEILRHLRAHVGSSRAHDDFTLVVVGIHEIPETVPAFVPAQAGTLPEAGVVTS
jgi:serine phosphatase RsbU (regulator of sigma subunit)